MEVCLVARSHLISACQPPRREKKRELACRKPHRLNMRASSEDCARPRLEMVGVPTDRNTLQSAPFVEQPRGVRTHLNEARSYFCSMKFIHVCLSTRAIALAAFLRLFARLSLHLLQSHCENFGLSFPRCGARDVDVAVREGCLRQTAAC